MSRTIIVALLALASLDVLAIYKCEHGGKITYQSEPCLDGTSRPIQNSVSIVDSYDRRSPTKTATPTPRKRGGGIERESTVFIEGEHLGCAEHVARLKSIDQEARRKSTSRLKEERRLTRRWIEDHNCREIRF